MSIYMEMLKHYESNETLKTDLKLIIGEKNFDDKTKIIYYLFKMYRELNWNKVMKGNIEIVSVNFDHIGIVESLSERDILAIIEENISK